LFDLHDVRRIHVDQVNRLAVEQPVEVRGPAAVAAQQPVIAKNPQVTRAGDRLVGRGRDVVGIGQPVGMGGREHCRERVRVEPQEAEVEIRRP
jgi:hypothetical protein